MSLVCVFQHLTSSGFTYSVSILSVPALQTKTVLTLCSQDQVQSYWHLCVPLKYQLMLITLPYYFSPKPQLFYDQNFSYIFLLNKHHLFFASCTLCLPSQLVLLLLEGILYHFFLSGKLSKFFFSLKTSLLFHNALKYFADGIQPIVFSKIFPQWQHDIYHPWMCASHSLWSPQLRLEEL